MNSRERVLTALDHREPDRIPFDLGSVQVTGIHEIAYRNLRQALGLPETTTDLCDTIQQLAKVEDDVVERLGHGVCEGMELRWSSSMVFRSFDSGSHTEERFIKINAI